MNSRLKTQDSEWPDIQAFIDYAKRTRINPLVPLLLTSGGTLTTALQVLSKSVIHLEVVQQTTSEIDNYSAQFLGLQKPLQVINRKIWLLNEKKERLVYAISVIPVNSLTPSVNRELILKKRSIGEFVESLQLPSIKDKMRFAKIRSVSLQNEFHLLRKTPFWYRRYRLSVPNHLFASIEEIFSPSLFNH